MALSSSMIKMLLRASFLLLAFLDMTGPALARRSYARYQRGDQVRKK